MSESAQESQHGPVVQELTLADKRVQTLEQCEQLMEHFNMRANRSKRTFERLRYMALTLTVAVATMASLEGVPRWTVAVASGAAALCTALLTAARPQEVWLQSRGTQQQLTAERFLFKQAAGDYATGDEVARVRLFAERIVAVWITGHTQWEQGRKEVASQPLSSKA